MVFCDVAEISLTLAQVTYERVVGRLVVLQCLWCHLCRHNGDILQQRLALAVGSCWLSLPLTAAYSRNQLIATD